jgi:hypothetical protein
MRTLLGESDAALSAKDIGAQVCDLQRVALEVVRAKRLAREVGGGGEEGEVNAAQKRVTQAAQRLFAAHQEMHRAAAKQNIEAALTTEQFARVHDLRMYTTLWHDGTVPAADVVADAIEVAETWAKLHNRLDKSAPESIEARIALAKKLETAIAREELKPK